MSCTHQGANLGLYPQLYVVGCAQIHHWEYPGKVSTKKPDDHEPEDLPSMEKRTFGAGVPERGHMSLKNISARDRSEFNLITVSTLHHLLVAGFTCAMLWAVIGFTISS